MIGVIVVLVLAYLLLRTLRSRRRRLQLERMAGRQSDESVPAPVSANGVAHQAEGRGRIVALDGDAAGTAYQFGAVPITLGSAASSDVRIDASADVAPRHALLWMKDDKMMLRHVGGIRRKTLVTGRPADWLILDDRDEIRIGAQRFRAEHVRKDQPHPSAAPTTPR